MFTEKIESIGLACQQPVPWPPTPCLPPHPLFPWLPSSCALLPKAHHLFSCPIEHGNVFTPLALFLRPVGMFKILQTKQVEAGLCHLHPSRRPFSCRPSCLHLLSQTSPRGASTCVSMSVHTHHTQPIAKPGRRSPVLWLGALPLCGTCHLRANGSSPLPARHSSQILLDWFVLYPHYS